MLAKQQPHHFTIVELTAGIQVQTGCPKICIPALRAGFALFPANPRWTVLKFRAWKTGRRLRQALDRGEKIVGDRDLVLLDPKPMKEASTAVTEPEMPGFGVIRLAEA